MKSGVVASTILHTAILTWGLWSLTAPEPLQVANTESLPVELISPEAFSQSMVGAKDAPITDKPAPTPTQKPQTLPMPAENVGDNEVDLKTPPTPQERPKEVEQAAAASPSEAAPDPQPEPDPAPTPQPPEVAPQTSEPEPQPTPVKAPSEPTPPDPIEQTIADAAVEPATPPQPKNVPVPADKPRPPTPPKVVEAKPEPAKPVETKKAEPKKPAPAKETKTAEQTAPDDSKFDADKIAALLNREKSAGGGAKRSTQQASLGTERKTGDKLSLSELDALRGQIQKCWSPPSGVSEAGSLRISIQMKLGPSGELEARPQIINGGGSSMIERVAGEAALRAVQRCAPYNLPAEKYDTWADVIVNFDPSQMF